MKSTISWIFIIFFLTMWSTFAWCQDDCTQDERFVQRLLERTPTRHGLCCVIDAGYSKVPFLLVEQSSFLVHMLDARPSPVAVGRKTASDLGLTLERLVIETRQEPDLPHADNTLDLLVGLNLDSTRLSTLAHTEVLRVLRPGGMAIFFACQDVQRVLLKNWALEAGIQALSHEEEDGAWVVVAAPPLEAGVDEWSDWQHGPDNNPVSNDATIRSPFSIQYLAAPPYAPMPTVTTVAGGRAFHAMGHIAYHQRQEPWLNTLLARNAFNGSELWKRKLPSGYMVHRSAFIAQENAFYLINPAGGGCLILDPETGRQTGHIVLPDYPGEWKWMALQDGILYALVGKVADKVENMTRRDCVVSVGIGVNCR